MTDITVPDIGDIDEVEVIELMVAVGDTVAVDDPIVVIESDKASMEVPATAAGVIESIAVAVGDMVSEGAVLATLSGAASDAENPDNQDEPSAAVESAAVDEPTQSAPVEVAEPVAASPATTGGTRVVEVLVPDIGDATDVVVIEIAVAVGDAVEEDDLLVVVESDKASMEIPSPQAGVVKTLAVAIDDNVSTDTLLLTLEVADAPVVAAEEQGAAQAKSAAEEPEAVQEKSVSDSAAPEAKPANNIQPAPPPKPQSSATKGSKGEVYAGPSVRRLARELGVDLTRVSGTGNRGRIVKDDVKQYVKETLNAPSGGAGEGGGIPAVPVVDFAKFGPVELEPMTRMRKTGATNLHRSWLNVVHVTQHDDVDFTEAEDFRKSLKQEGERKGVKVTPLAFLMKAVAGLLQIYPRFNASLTPDVDGLILKKYYNIGMAVDTEDGLLVPVIKDVDQKGIWQLSAEIAEIADKARNGKLGMGDLQGGTFSISSLGAIGGTGFTPIVNAPEVAILGVSKLATKPVWDGSEFVPRKMLPVSLSYNHRAINGAEAGRFVTDLGAALADLRRLLL